MKWGFRWYGAKDTIPLHHFRHVPGCDGVVGTLLGKLPGEVWPIEEIQAFKESIEKERLELLAIESVAVCDAIKAGTEERDHYIDNYIQTIRNIGACGIKLVVYSFKPIFGWAKTHLKYENPDGTYSLVFDQSVVDNMQASEMFQLIKSQSGGFNLSGWEEERFKEFNNLMKMYEGMTREDLFNNLAYFLKRVIPVCEEVDVKLGIHPDDPPWEIFGLPRITKNLEDYKRIMEIVDSPYNGITLCTGSVGANPDCDVAQMIRELGDRIHFVHLRNVEYLGKDKFRECAHLSLDGSLDMYELMKALVDIGFDGVIRPDHGRAIWDEVAMPGYGLYDRALGFTYLQGLHEAITKCKKEKE